MVLVWEMTANIAQMFHRAIGKTAVGRNLGQMSPPTCAGDEGLLNSPEEAQINETSVAVKKRRAQVDHRAGNAKNELARISLDL